MIIVSIISYSLPNINFEHSLPNGNDPSSVEETVCEIAARFDLIGSVNRKDNIAARALSGIPVSDLCLHAVGIFIFDKIGPRARNESEFRLL